MIEVRNLTKNYGDFTAVSDLSFTIEQGHIYGFLGPNGAGKSTTMNIITGCLAATSGEVLIGGHDIFEEPKEAKKLIGYLPELPPLYQEQTVREYLTFVAQAKGIGRKSLEDVIEGVAEEVHITDVLDRLISHLSKGYRQRVGIAQALIGDPEVIILDEPTVGLDPAQIIEIRQLITQLGESRTVIISSHILSEIQSICDKVLIIHKGKLVLFDDIENISSALTAASAVELSADACKDDVSALLSGIEGISETQLTALSESRTAATLTVTAEEPEDVCRSIFTAFAATGLTLTRLTAVKKNLEDVFIELTSEEGAKPAGNSEDYGEEYFEAPEEFFGETVPEEFYAAPEEIAEAEDGKEEEE